MSILTKTKEKPTGQVLRELGKIIDISIGLIRTSPKQPRRYFDTAELTSLAKSIAQDGIVQPLTVRKSDCCFELISGERRLRAAKIAGLRSVPCVVVNVSDERSAVIALIENIQRANLSFFEEAEAILKLLKDYSMTQEEAAIRLGMAQSTLANKLRLLKLSPQERKIIFSNKLSERHARALLKIEDPQKRHSVLLHIIQNKLNVDATERYIKALESQAKLEESYRKRSPVLKDVKLFFNTVDKALHVMKLAGVDAKVKKSRHDGVIEYTILIPDEQKEE